MTRLGVLACLVGCGAAARQPAPSEQSGTPLVVVVLDDYPTRASCEGIAARRLEIVIDGRLAGDVRVPCATTIQAPPRQFAARPIVLGAGRHRIVIRDPATGLEGARELELPVLEESDDGEALLATKLPVWANDDELDVQELRARLKEL